MAKPVKLPQWDTNLTNSVEPVSGRKTDGYATNDVPASSNLNFLFAYIYLWLKWVDDGVWTAVSLVLSGTFSSRGITSTGIDGDGSIALVATPGGTFTGGNGSGGGSSANGAAGVVLNGGAADDGGVAGSAATAVGGHAGGNPGDLGAPAFKATGGLNQDATYADAFDAPHGGLTLHDGGISTTKNIATSAGNLIAGGTGSSIAPPVRTLGAGILSNGWANQGGTSEVFGYWKDAFGVLHIDGLLDAGAATTGVIATLSAVGSIRPLKDSYWDVLDVATGNVARILVNTSGVISYTGTIGGGGLKDVALSGISYRTV